MRSVTRRPSLFNLLGSKLPKPVRTFGVGLVDFPDGPYDDEPAELPESLYHEPDADEPETGHVYWNSELEYLESLLPLSTPARRVEIERRIDAVLGMLGIPAPVRRPRLFEPNLDDRAWWAAERDREERESMERQQEAAWLMTQIEDALRHGRNDGRVTDEDVMITGACG